MMRRLGIFLFLLLNPCQISYGFLTDSVVRIGARKVALGASCLMVHSKLRRKECCHDDQDEADMPIGGEHVDKAHSQFKGRHLSRRECISSSLLMTTAAATTGLTMNPASASAEFKPSVRPTAYRVDSTIPPSLLPIKEKNKIKILTGLGKGSGTDKEAVFIDTLNLNNILNKAVFGTIDAVSGIGNPKASDSGPGFASFVCFGLPSQKTSTDIDLALQLLDPIVQPRKALPTGLGLAGFPYSAQANLNAYSKGEMSVADLESNLQNQAGIESDALELFRPMLVWAKQNNVDLLALSPEKEDAETARLQGLQFVNPERRSSYIIDPEGFIGLTQDARFKMYTDRSLLKDFAPRNDKETSGNFYAERILVHEAGATAASQYASSRPDSLVIIMAPIQDVRFLNGINGRIPRVFGKLRQSADDSQVTEKSVTTILLNPTARDTLSKSNYLRLEIGTAPEVLDYQTKVADYLWFSSSVRSKTNCLRSVFYCVSTCDA